jgi:hypothetical protein
VQAVVAGRSGCRVKLVTVINGVGVTDVLWADPSLTDDEWRSCPPEPLVTSRVSRSPEREFAPDVAAAVNCEAGEVADVYGVTPVLGER